MQRCLLYLCVATTAFSSTHAAAQSIDGYQATLPPHLRVAFVLQSLRHEVVAGDGVPVGDLYPATLAQWQSTSPISTAERFIPGLPPPPAGNELTFETAPRVVYDGIVEEGCGSTPVFPIEFSSTIESTSEGPIGSFEASDGTTLEPNGFWTFEYGIEAATEDGDVSHFIFRGVVSATCVSFNGYRGTPEDPVLPAGIQASFASASEPMFGTQQYPTSTARGHAVRPFLAPHVGPVPLHCDGNTGYSCDKYKQACEDFGGEATCTPVQVPDVMGGGTNGSVCGCEIPWPEELNATFDPTPGTFTQGRGTTPLDPGVPSGFPTPSPAPQGGADGLLDPGASAEGGSQCLVDFSDPGALALSEPSLWFDRIYVPWFQSCFDVGYVDLRQTIASHFHLGFADTEVEPCFSDPQAYPSTIDDEGDCHFVDVETTARTHVYSHTTEEVFRLRVWNPGLDDYEAFDLDQIRVQSAGVELCYYKAVEAPSEWEAANPGGAPHAWYCWEDLGPGTWDLTAWAWDVQEVTITGAEGNGTPVAFDDILVSP